MKIEIIKSTINYPWFWRGRFGDLEGHGKFIAFGHWVVRFKTVLPSLR